MKITDLAIVFILIAGPFLWVISLHTQDRLEAQLLSNRYTTILRTAAQDGGSELSVNDLQQFEPGYDSLKYFRANREKALNAMLHTLYMNFGVGDDPISQRAFLNYIPAVLVVDYDGYYIYSQSEYLGMEGEPLTDHKWGLKRPYVYADKKGNIYRFTLDRKVTVYDANTGRWANGLRDELSEGISLSLLSHKDEFEAKRRIVIVQSIEEDLARIINKHNQYSARSGHKYKFALPTISAEEWNNTLNDIGILVFLQGIPVGDQYYNNYALGGGRLMKRPVIYGGLNPITGIKYYYREPCQEEYKLEEVFTNEREAAAKGYFEAEGCRKRP